MKVLLRESKSISGRSSLGLDIHRFASEKIMIAGVFLKQVFPVLRLFGVLGWLPAKIDPKSGFLTLRISSAYFGYCILINVVLFAANVPTFYSGMEVSC